MRSIHPAPYLHFATASVCLTHLLFFCNPATAQDRNRAVAALQSERSAIKAQLALRAPDFYDNAGKQIQTMLSLDTLGIAATSSLPPPLKAAGPALQALIGSLGKLDSAVENPDNGETTAIAIREVAAALEGVASKAKHNSEKYEAAVQGISAFTEGYAQLRAGKTEQAVDAFFDGAVKSMSTLSTQVIRKRMVRGIAGDALEAAYDVFKDLGIEKGAEPSGETIAG